MKSHNGEDSDETDGESESEWETQKGKPGFQNKEKKEKKKRKNEKTEKKENDNEKENPEETKDIVCRFFKKARCHHGMSGKMSYNGVARCPYKHPTICSRLLRHGDRG